MEQMGNFLLGKAAQLSKSSVNETSVNAGSGDFLSALNQVSQSQDKQTQSNATSSFSLAQDTNLVTATTDQEAAQTDVELILSQIGLLAQTELAANNASLVGNDLPLELIEGIDAVDDEVLSTEALLAQLGAENQDSLAAFAGQDLSELSPQELAALIENYNAQAADNNLPLIQLSDSMMAWLQAQAAQAVDGPDMQSIPNGKIQPTVLPNDKLHILGAEKSQGSNTDTLTAIPNADLAKAEFGVTLDALAENIKQGTLASSGQMDTLTSSLESEGNPLEIKALQNQSSFTPLHKSDVPQFQLSLRQGAEPGQQLQDMIQKFAPVMQQQLITMVSKGIQQAEIRLDPPELGHMLVKIHVQGDQTQVQFQVVHSQTKDLVEQSLPKLREMLAQEGMLLSDSHVSQGDGREQKGRQHGGASESHDSLDENSAQETPLTTNRTSGLNSAIDYYA